jgi:predicted outer membrane lipoprotein
MYYVPTDWFLGGSAEAWYFGLFIGAGVLLAAAFGLFAQKAFVDDHMFTTRVTVATVLALVALAGAVTFAVILII